MKAFQWIDWQYNWLTIYLMKTTLYQKQMHKIFTTIEILQHKECLKCLQEGKGKVESCWLTRWYFSAAPVYSSVSLRWWTNNQPYFFLQKQLGLVVQTTLVILKTNRDTFGGEPLHCPAPFLLVLYVDVPQTSFEWSFVNKYAP